MRLTTLAVVVLLSGPVLAGDEATIDIEVVRDDTSFSFSSAAAGFNPFDLQVGENRSYMDEDGRNVLITRTEEGITVDADGQRLDIPAPQTLHDEELQHAHAIEIQRRVESLGHDETLIVTQSLVDDATQDSIRALLKKAGHDAEVRFVDDSRGLAGLPRREVHVVHKEL